ncbi:MAG: hypothetical protein QOG85_2647 [Gaiellaceae bacterium]|jgi:hypothetical protein|nr:hypothetical protein [Gaiellaceae bacterium]
MRPRRLIAVVVVVLAVGGAGYLGIHPFNYRVFSKEGVGCPGPRPLSLELYQHPKHSPCVPPSRFAWQIPAALLLALAGFGAAAIVATGPHMRKPRADRATRAL